MSKRVLVVASGETERRALPELLRDLGGEGIELLDVRIPPRHRDLTVASVAPVIRAAYFELEAVGRKPNKVVVLKDTDGREPGETIEQLQRGLPARLVDLEIVVLVAYAQRHLEAWFFGDSPALRSMLQRNLGSVDASTPDEILNPKQHLRQLLDHQYTALVAGRIAQQLDPGAIEQRSPSFAAFRSSVRNGAIE